MTIKTTPRPRAAVGPMPLFGMSRSHSGNPRGIHFDGEGNNGGGGDAGGGTGDGGGAGDASKVNFTPEQLTALNTAVNEAVNNATAPLKKKLTDYEKAAEDAKKKPAGKEGEGAKDGERTVPETELQRQLADQGTKHADEVKRLSETITGMRNTQKRAAVIDAAAKANAVDPGDVAALVDSAIDFDERGELVVKNPDGTLIYGNQGKPMGVEAFVADFLAKKPHLVKSSGVTGGGSGGDGNKQQAGGEKATTGIGKIASGLKNYGK